DTNLLKIVGDQLVTAWNTEFVQNSSLAQMTQTSREFATDSMVSVIVGQSFFALLMRTRSPKIIEFCMYITVPILCIRLKIVGDQPVTAQNAEFAQNSSLAQMTQTSRKFATDSIKLPKEK
ncbi:hypothetical protein L9F63_024061, partial [Diploptera punctata]